MSLVDIYKKDPAYYEEMVARANAENKVLSESKGKLILLEPKDTRTYAEKRAMEYPEIGEQLDMIWHAIDSGESLDKESDFYKALKAVKDKYPKEG